MIEKFILIQKWIHIIRVNFLKIAPFVTSELYELFVKEIKIKAKVLETYYFDSNSIVASLSNFTFFIDWKHNTPQSPSY